MLFLSGSRYANFKSTWDKTGGPLIWKAATRAMNPTINAQVINAALKDDYTSAKDE
jgi:hypothetical protein